jgi:hypothetical protein
MRLRGIVVAILLSGLLALPAVAQAPPPPPSETPREDCGCGVPASPRGPR